MQCRKWQNFLVNLNKLILEEMEECRESFLNIIRTRIQEKLPAMALQAMMSLLSKSIKIRKIEQLVADDSPLWTTTELDGWSSIIIKRPFRIYLMT